MSEKHTPQIDTVLEQNRKKEQGSEDSKKAREARNAYHRQWRKKNPEKARQYQEKYWANKYLKMLKESTEKTVQVENVRKKMPVAEQRKQNEYLPRIHRFDYSLFGLAHEAANCCLLILEAMRRQFPSITTEKQMGTIVRAVVSCMLYGVDGWPNDRSLVSLICEFIDEKYTDELTRSPVRKEKKPCAET